VERRGLFIDIEGIDGSGKAEQCKRLAAWLREEGRSVRVLTYPDLKSAYGKTLNEFLRGKIQLDVKTQFLTFAADIMKDQESVLQSIEAGEIVVTDRYLTSTVAYQCAKGLSLEGALLQVELFSPLKPDLILWLDVSPATGIKRRRKKRGRRKKDVHDTDEALLLKVRANYSRLYSNRWLGRDWARMDGEKPIGEVAEEVKALVSPLLR
jgi:dTMP kinase